MLTNHQIINKHPLKPKVAILQNQIGLDGRSRVIIQMINLLNERGTIPDVLTFSNPANVEKFRKGYNLNIEFNLCRIPLPYTIGCLHQMILLNILSRSKLKKYDLVINSNDTLFFLPSSVFYIHYIHDPLEATFSDARRGLGRPWWNYYVRFLETICAFSRPDHSNSILLTNSEFTRQRLIEHYPFIKERITVVYPPTVPDIPDWKELPQRQVDVVSLGTFSPHKNQLLQLEIARKLPHFSFVLVGSIWSQAYFRDCEAFIARHQLQNTTLVPDAPLEDLEKILGSAKLFLHTKKDEGFGISTVQAMASGCVPLVPDSGGSKEVVPWPALRFQDEQEIAGKIEELLSNDNSILEYYRQKVRNHILQFTVGHFQEKMGQVLSKALAGC